MKNNIMETQTVETDKARLNDEVGQEQVSPELLNKMNAYWRAANYLSVGQMYLHQNPLLREPLKPGLSKAAPKAWLSEYPSSPPS